MQNTHVMMVGITQKGHIHRDLMVYRHRCRPWRSYRRPALTSRYACCSCRRTAEPCLFVCKQHQHERQQQSVLGMCVPLRTRVEAVSEPTAPISIEASAY